MSMEDEIILRQIERGGDFLLPIAQGFFQDYSFDQFSNSQLRNLHREICCSTGLADMEKKVNDWLQKQSKRKKGQIWETVKESLPKILFDWTGHKEDIIDMALSGIDCEQTILDISEIKYLITEENLKDDLKEAKFRLAKKLFNILITLHRCHAVDEIRDKIAEFPWGETVEA
ncbi:MAG: hypothetical protein K8F52_08810 [Candidatus Scalindua rubra]|uniref:Uncharacterized protein n=1 Tax=Candidatus Scalindua brodae TaxID=237368 RepID=A0A0B0EMU5_9BACT|nr:MAG: hypothetical protein SCABRO_01768 [Candidatus Scalindua brodae]MBZ0108759.1 hypothetical protein [Candidatus Scalindua rubra]TWU30944.1 hypothetical protein S225a_23870 [Candidatus Brocadiaceae bacterium S225]